MSGEKQTACLATSGAGQRSAEEVRIRPLKAEDGAALAQMERKIFSVPWSEQSFRGLLEHAYQICLVAETGNVLVGCAVLTMLGDEGDIDKVMVDDAFRGQGIGRRLVRTLMEQGAQRGVREWTLEVRAGNTPAICLYEALGFVSEGIRPGFYGKPTEDALIMWLRRPQ